jgi:cell division protein FtsB
LRRAVRLLIAAVLVGGVVFLFVLPGRTWLQQRAAMNQAAHRLQVLQAENAVLARRAAQLQDPAYIERIAREQYGLVMPGQQAYGIIPPAVTTTTTVPGA